MPLTINGQPVDDTNHHERSYEPERCAGELFIRVREYLGLGKLYLSTVDDAPPRFLEIRWIFTANGKKMWATVGVDLFSVAIYADLDHVARDLAEQLKATRRDDA